MPGLTIAAMVAADGHMESSCSSVREGTPEEDTQVKDPSLVQTHSLVKMNIQCVCVCVFVSYSNVCQQPLLRHFPTLSPFS